MKSVCRIGFFVLAAVLASVPSRAAEPGSEPRYASSAEEGMPDHFLLGPQGDLKCVGGASEDSCAYHEAIAVPGKTLFLVQGTYSVKTHPSQLRQIGPHILQYSFALLCESRGNVLTPVANLLEGRERSSDVHVVDLDGDGVSEIVVVGVFDARGSYAAAYRLETGSAVRIFHRRANTPSADFDTELRQILLEQRDPKTHGDLVREVFAWDGKGFVLQS